MIVQRIIFEMQQRIDRLASEPELTMVQEWITRYLNFAQKHMITMDSLQETILKEVFFMHLQIQSYAVIFALLIGAGKTGS